MEGPIGFVIRVEEPSTVDMLREHAKRRLGFALRRFEHRVGRITVRLIDQNGPRRGVDSRCAITAELVDGRRIFVEAITAWPFASITRAAARLNHALSRELRRRSSARAVSARG
jgi:hypothetical protein